MQPRVAVVVAALLLVGCGGSAKSDGGASGSGGTDAGSGGASGQNSGECSTDAECAPGVCVELSPGGYRVCKMPVVEATECTNPGLDTCCSTADCASGKCLASPLIQFCGGAEPQPSNSCAEDQCQSNAGCTREGRKVCVPAGALDYKVAGCMPVNCLLDGECTREPGGKCILLRDSCCGAARGLYCTYPSNGCRKDSDCPNGYCAPEKNGAFDGSVAVCHSGPIACPN
ncbi:MAG: hypothetical protein R3B13_20985 [Polyangiaceae bacterium]